MVTLNPRHADADGVWAPSILLRAGVQGRPEREMNRSSTLRYLATFFSVTPCLALPSQESTHM
jgi:hypothetical protein